MPIHDPRDSSELRDLRRFELRVFRRLRALSALALGVLAGYALAFSPRPTPADPEASDARSLPPMVQARRDAAFLLDAARRYRARNGVWPGGLETLRRAGEIASTRRDPWGGTYRFFMGPHEEAMALCASGRPPGAREAVCFW